VVEAARSAAQRRIHIVADVERLDAVIRAARSADR
jgi:hypothetical protein